MENNELLKQLQSLLGTLTHIKGQFAYYSEHAEPADSSNEDFYWGALNGMQHTYDEAAGEMESPIDELKTIISELEQTIRDNTPPTPPAPGQLSLPLDAWEHPDHGDWDITNREGS